MADSDKKVTFELKDLSYEELVDSYLEVCEFLTFLNDSKVGVKGAISIGEDPDSEDTEETADNQNQNTEAGESA